MSQLRRAQTIAIAAAILFGSLVTILAANAAKTPVAQATLTPQKSWGERVKRGKYLVTIGGCHDCHTPWTVQPDGKPGPDMSRALSGHPMQFPIKEPAQLNSDRFAVAIAPMNTAYSGPWGVSFAANLTPDKMTGTGIWTFDIFKNTIRTGRHWGVARPLLPPMPWFNYREMTDDDLHAVFTYLRTLKPVYNEVPAPVPPATTKKES